MKYKLSIQISDLVRAKTSQIVIDELMELYDDLESPKADITRASFFTNGFLRGIHISIKCENKNDGRRYREEFNSVYESLTRRLKRKPVKVISFKKVLRGGDKMKANFNFYLNNPKFKKGIKNCEFADICEHKFCNQYVINVYDNREFCIHPKNLEEKNVIAKNIFKVNRMEELDSD